MQFKAKAVNPKHPIHEMPEAGPNHTIRLPKSAKDVDHNLARLQTLILDAAALPLGTREAARNRCLTP